MGNPYFSYGGKSLHERLHGEAFIALFEHRQTAARRDLGDGRTRGCG
jgi:predicted ATPase